MTKTPLGYRIVTSPKVGVRGPQFSNFTLSRPIRSAYTNDIALFCTFNKRYVSLYAVKFQKLQIILRTPESKS